MSALVKYKHPVEYSFRQWMGNYPESHHWADRERFIQFTKNVYVHNASKYTMVCFVGTTFVKYTMVYTMVYNIQWCALRAPPL